MDLKLYEPTIHCQHDGLLSCVEEFQYDDPKVDGLVKAFVNDDNIQQMTLASMNLGVFWQYTKRYKNDRS